MKISVTHLKPLEVHTKKERADRRKAAYSFLLGEIRAMYGGADLPEEVQESREEERGSGERQIFPFVKDPLGKPYLPGHPGILFNLSHSRNGYAAAVIADSSEASAVGIDIERRFPYHDLLARKICHPAEADALGAAASAEEKAGLLNIIWSRKEAILKCEGTGIRSSLSALDTIHIDERLYELTEFQTDDYTLCVCKKRITSD